MDAPKTLTDIAKALNLSPSTVSRAMTGSTGVSPLTKKRVLNYAEKLNYKPNASAVSLKARRSFTIGVIVSEVANDFFAQVINGIESVAYELGYRVIISQTHESLEREVVSVRHLASRSIDGLLVSLSSETSDHSHLKYWHDRGLPIVFFDRVAVDMETHKISADNFKGAFDATEYLIQTGYTKIGHVTGASHLSITQERLLGYQAALARYHLDFNPSYLYYCEHGGMIQEEVDQAVNKLLDLPDKIQAIFAAADRLSTGCIKSLNKYHDNLLVPLPIAGFMNGDTAMLFKHPLVVIRQPSLQIGRLAAEMLIQLIDAKTPVRQFNTYKLGIELHL
jgi:LacI family transcriptional regulator